MLKRYTICFFVLFVSILCLSGCFGKKDPYSGMYEENFFDPKNKDTSLYFLLEVRRIHPDNYEVYEAILKITSKDIIEGEKVTHTKILRSLHDRHVEMKEGLPVVGYKRNINIDGKLVLKFEPSSFAKYMFFKEVSREGNKITFKTGNFSELLASSSHRSVGSLFRFNKPPIKEFKTITLDKIKDQESLFED